jgi:hypothetical protein
VLCLIVIPLPPGKNTFAVLIIIKYLVNIKEADTFSLALQIGGVSNYFF